MRETSLVTLAIILLLLWAFAILWKKPVFLSTSFSQTSLDFYFQLIYSIRADFLKYAFELSLADFSSKDKVPCTFLESQNSTWDKTSNFLTITFPKTFVFHFFKKPLRFFKIYDKTKLGDPLKLRVIHQDFINSLKTFSLSHIFLNMKGASTHTSHPMELEHGLKQV